MRKFLPVLLLCGCASVPVQREDVAQSPAFDGAVRLTEALNDGDIAYLQSAFQPPHPLAELGPSFANEANWHALRSEWMADLLLHSQYGQWDLRQANAQNDKAGQRVEYRLVHEDYSVEYFYFDVQWSGDGLRIDDMGNRLFVLSQVDLMDALYRRLITPPNEDDIKFAEFFTQLGPFNRGEIRLEQLFARYLALSEPMQGDLLVRDLLLRALMAQGVNWETQVPPDSAARLLGSDYPLLDATLCLQELAKDCDKEFEQLPPDLKQDIALQAEMGIRALQRQDLPRARRFASLALVNDSDYFPAYWLQMQLGIVSGDHKVALAGLDRLVQHFDVQIDRQMLLQLYPEQGQAFLQSAQFRRWAEQFPEE